MEIYHVLASADLKKHQVRLLSTLILLLEVKSYYHKVSALVITKHDHTELCEQLETIRGLPNVS